MSQWVYPLTDGRIVLVPHAPTETSASVWNVAEPTGQPYELRLPDGWRAAALDPRGRHLAVGASRQRLQVLETKTLSVVVDRATDLNLFRMGYDPEGRELAITLGDGAVHMVDPLGSRPGRTIGEPVEGNAWYPSFTPDGSMIAYSLDGKQDGPPATVVVRDRLTGAVRHTFDPFSGQKGHYTFVRTVMSPVASLLACVAYRGHYSFGWTDSRVRVWDLSSATASELQLSFPPGAGAGCLAFSPNGEELAVGSETGEVHVCEIPSGRLKRSIRIGPSFGIVNDLRYAPDGRHLITSNGNGSVYVLRLADGPR